MADAAAMGGGARGTNHGGDDGKPLSDADFIQVNKKLLSRTDHQRGVPGADGRFMVFQCARVNGVSPHVARALRLRPSPL